MSHFITVADPNPGFKTPLIFGWSGMRGVVSLAAALSIPILINGQPFPYRNLILFITFIVILMTLVLQGLTLPWLIKKVKLEDRYGDIPIQKQEIIIQKKIAQYSLQFLEEKYGNDWSKNERLDNLHSKLQIDLKLLSNEIENADNSEEGPRAEHQRVYLELLDHQRKLLNKMNHHKEFDEEVIRKYLALVDIEEFKLRAKLLNR
jgi:CPA1 family monovalent cation:H+ antiporter